MATLSGHSKQKSLGGALNVTTPSFTISGANLVIWAFVGGADVVPAASNAVKWDGSAGEALTQIDSTRTTDLNSLTNNATLGGEYSRFTAWEKIAPTAKTSTGYTSFPSSQDEILLVMVAFSGVDQATPKNAIVYANSTGTAPSANASSTSGQTVLGCEFSVEYTASSGTVTAAQTAIDEVEGADTTFETLGNSYTTASGSSTTMNWTLSITSWWSVFAFSINDAAGGGGTTLTRYWWDMIGADD